MWLGWEQRATVQSQTQQGCLFLCCQGWGRWGAQQSQPAPAHSSREHMEVKGGTLHLSLGKKNPTCFVSLLKSKLVSLQNGSGFGGIGECSCSVSCPTPGLCSVLKLPYQSGGHCVLCPTASWVLRWSQVPAMNEPLGRHHPKCCLGAGCVPFAPSWSSCVGRSMLKAVRWD